MSNEYRYIVTARDTDGREAHVTVGLVEGAVYYNEYRTGPRPWWKRAWYRPSRR